MKSKTITVTLSLDVPAWKEILDNMPRRVKELETDDIMHTHKLPIEYIYSHFTRAETKEWLTKVLTSNKKICRYINAHHRTLLSRMIHNNMQTLIRNIDSINVGLVESIEHGCYMLMVAGLIIEQAGKHQPAYIDNTIKTIINYIFDFGRDDAVETIKEFVDGTQHDLTDYKLCSMLAKHLDDLRSHATNISTAHS